MTERVSESRAVEALISTLETVPVIGEMGPYRLTGLRLGDLESSCSTQEINLVLSGGFDTTAIEGNFFPPSHKLAGERESIPMGTPATPCRHEKG